MRSSGNEKEPPERHQWRMLPKEFPKWRTVHSYFAIWSEPREGSSPLEQALKNQVGAARERLGRNACSTLLIVDAQSVKSTVTAALKGYDASKKVSGIKRHIAVDTQGQPHAAARPRSASPPSPSIRHLRAQSRPGRRRLHRSSRTGRLAVRSSCWCRSACPGPGCSSGRGCAFRMSGWSTTPDF